MCAGIGSAIWPRRSTPAARSTSVEDLRRRVPSLSLAHPRGARHRRSIPIASASTVARALWAAGAMSQTSADRLPGIVTGVEAHPALPGMSPQELSHADLWATGVDAPDGHPPRSSQGDLTERGVVTATDLADVASEGRVLVGWGRHPSSAAGHRPGHDLPQPRGRDRPDRTWIVSKGCWQRYKQIAKGAPALLIRVGSKRGRDQHRRRQTRTPTDWRCAGVT